MGDGGSDITVMGVISSEKMSPEVPGTDTAFPSLRRKYPCKKVSVLQIFINKFNSHLP